jgi:23S rRNA (adenine2503-C2)-methyltransferase
MTQPENNKIDVKSIYDMDYEAIVQLVTSFGEPAYRAKQLWQGLYHHYWRTPDEFSTLSKSFRVKLAQNIKFSLLTNQKVQQSTDKRTEKTLFSVANNLFIETVLMSYKLRNTICISTQAGCAMGCSFCATGQMGFRRNLKRGEIVEQVIYYARSLATRSQRITNVVLMGMGEPFHNYDETLAAIDRLNHPEGFNFAARRFTISTVGLVPMIRRFTSERRQINLAISLHAADDDLRSSLLPINRKYPLDILFNACQDYVNQTKRRITFEWALIRDINDSPQQAKMLSDRIGNMLAHINIIQLNPTNGFDGLPSTRERAARFKEELENHGISCTIRLRRGIDIQAGCGQLAGINTLSGETK